MTIDSVVLLEKDANGDVLATWAFPGVDSETETVLIARSQLQADVMELDFTFSRFHDLWLYIYTTVVSADPQSKLPEVTAFSICVFAKTFNPEKYNALSRMFAFAYNKTADPVQIMEGSLRVQTTNQWHTFKEADFDVRKSWLASPLTGLVQQFGDQVMLLWTALLLKKRILIFCPQLERLQEIIRAVPLLAFHRQHWDVLQPFVNPSDVELADLKSHSSYVAGFTDVSVVGNDLLYDLLLDASSNSFQINPSAKDDLAMGSFHSQVAKMLLGAVSEQQSDQQVIKALTLKTNELLQQLRDMVAEDGLQGIRTKKMSAAMERFCVNLAIAENL